MSQNSDDISIIERLKLARRLHFQGLNEDAIREYEQILELDPDNIDAISGLRALGIEPSISSHDHEGNAVGHAGGLKTNFFTNQAKASNSSALKANIFKFVILGIGIGACYGGYILVNYILNYDNVQALNNVEVHFEKPLLKDGQGTVNVEIININPGPIKHMKVSYRIADAGDTTIKEGLVELPGQVPAGDRRTFAEISLGEIKGMPAKLSPKLESLIYGPKPKLKDKIVDKFMKAAAQRDKDALADYEELTQETEDFAPAFVGLGRSFAAKGKMDQALEQYKKALEIDPQNANAHYYTAVALFYKGDKETAKKEIDQAMQIAPDDPEISWNYRYLFALKDAKKNDKNKTDSSKNETAKEKK